MVFNFGKQRVRVTGVGPWSIQWEYLESNEGIARAVLADLDNRRVLFDHLGREDPEFCRQSAAEIRKMMTEHLPKVDQGDDMDRSLRAIRQAAIDFDDKAGPHSAHFLRSLGFFWTSLEEMRSEMAPHIRSMSQAYEIMIGHVLDESLPRHELTVSEVK